MKAVLFDLDGTILDTRDMILASFRHAYIEVVGTKQLPPDEKLLAMVGIPLKDQMDIIAPEHSEELMAAYRAHNQLIHDEMLRGFAGTEEALAALGACGLRMAVVTSKWHSQAMHGLEYFGLEKHFEFLLGADETSEHKPKPGPLLAAAERMGLRPEECTYVGDSPFDMTAARAAAMYAVGALWGMFSEESLLEAGAQIIVPTIAELPDVIRR